MWPINRTRHATRCKKQQLANRAHAHMFIANDVTVTYAHGAVDDANGKTRTSNEARDNIEKHNDDRPHRVLKAGRGGATGQISRKSDWAISHMLRRLHVVKARARAMKSDAEQHTAKPPLCIETRTRTHTHTYTDTNTHVTHMAVAAERTTHLLSIPARTSRTGHYIERTAQSTSLSPTTTTTTTTCACDFLKTINTARTSTKKTIHSSAAN